MKTSTIIVMTTTSMLATMALVFLVLTTTPVFAHGHGESHGWSEARIERLADKLELTKEQRDSVRAVIDKTRPQMRVLRDAWRDNRKQLHALMAQDTPNETQLRALADAQGKTLAELIVLRADIRAQIGKILTEQQREQLRQRHDRWSHRED